MGAYHSSKSSSEGWMRVPGWLSRLTRVGLGASLASAAPVALPSAGAWDDLAPTHDGVVHRYCFVSGFNPVAIDNVQLTNETTDAWSDMDAQPEFCDVFVAPVTDVVWDTTVDLPNGWRGLWDCRQYHSSWPPFTTCDGGLANMDIAEVLDGPFPDGGTFENNLTALACHENGHSMGFQHYKGTGGLQSPPDDEHDCMYSGGVNNAGHWRVYSDHHKNQHINPQFP